MRFNYCSPIVAIWLLAAPIAAISWVPAAAQTHTPARGTLQRAAILDAVRPMVEAELGAPVEFVVNHLRVLGEWAFVSLIPQRSGGGAIAYSYTRYQAAFDSGMFDGQATALLRQTAVGWLIYEYNLGATDVVWVEWPDWYPVPPELFP